MYTLYYHTYCRGKTFLFFNAVQKKNKSLALLCNIKISFLKTIKEITQKLLN